jgi:hypothetical protein
MFEAFPPLHVVVLCKGMIFTSKMTVFWVVAPCSLVEVYQCFRGACSLHHQGNSPLDSKRSLMDFTDLLRVAVIYVLKFMVIIYSNVVMV